MRVLQVISSSRASGAERHVVLLTRELRRLGHQVEVVCPQGGWLPDRLLEAGAPTHAVQMRGGRSLGAVMLIRRLLRDGGIDIVHTHLTRAAYLACIAARGLRVPLVSTMHVLTRDLGYRRVADAELTFISVSDHIRRSLLARGVAPDRVRTVHNGTDLVTVPSARDGERARVRSNLNLPTDAPVIGVFGRVDHFKGQHLLVRAAPEVSARHPGVHYLFVGEARPQAQQALWNLSHALQVSQHVRFTGLRSDVPQLMRACDVVALPSVYEACSMVILEAMAMERPVVATRAGGNPELVEDGVTGMLFERNPRDIAKAVCTVLDDRAARERMGALAGERARAHFGARRMAREIAGAYQDVVAARGASARAL